MTIKKPFLYFLSLLIFILITIKFLHYSNRAQVEMNQGHISCSDDKKWIAYITSGSSESEHYFKLYLFNTKAYPELIADGKYPSTYQKNNPTALYYLPLKFIARQTSFEWNTEDHKLIIKQPSVNSEKEIFYEVDLKDFSFIKLK